MWMLKLSFCSTLTHKSTSSVKISWAWTSLQSAGDALQLPDRHLHSPPPSQGSRHRVITSRHNTPPRKTSKFRQSLGVKAASRVSVPVKTAKVQSEMVAGRSLHRWKVARKNNPVHLRQESCIQGQTCTSQQLHIKSHRWRRNIHLQESFQQLPGNSFVSERRESAQKVKSRLLSLNKSVTCLHSSLTFLHLPLLYVSLQNFPQNLFRNLTTFHSEDLNSAHFRSEFRFVVLNVADWLNTLLTSVTAVHCLEELNE